MLLGNLVGCPHTLQLPDMVGKDVKRLVPCAKIYETGPLCKTLGAGYDIMRYDL